MRSFAVAAARYGAIIVLLALHSSALDAQYFGRNKVRGDKFDFRVLQSAHFDAYHYPAESVATNDAARMAERWYVRLSTLLGEQLKRRSLVFYADAPDFQQTNVVGELIGQGTGGVTESARSRVIMPFTGVYADNDHVLGHELVHVFQYDIADTLSRTPGAKGPGINALPLWLIEGMAEYLSLGRNDPNTAMWLRDAVLRNDLPTIRQLTRDSRFFPYRYGEALWAYVGGKWGDQMVGTLFRASLQHGFEPAIKRVLGITADSLSKKWHAAIRAAYTPLMADLAKPRDVGVRLLPSERRETGMMEVSPALSPDGQYVAFLSSRNLVSVDLFVAETRTGRIVHQLTTPNRDEHFGSLSFIASAGSWSPDGRQLAYVTFANGDNEIAIFDVARKRAVKRFNLGRVGAVSDVAWGPGGEIALAGTSGGISDIYLLDPRTGQLRQLTGDRFADLQPAWSPDGRTIAFATDRGGTDFDRLAYGPLQLATIDVATCPAAGVCPVRLLPVFRGAKHITPQFAPDGRSLFFVSDRDGISNVYRVSLADGATYQVTRVATGVSGITSLSPALTVAARSGEMIFSVFDNAGQMLVRLDRAATSGIPVSPRLATRSVAGVLPPVDAASSSRVVTYLADAETGLPAQQTFPVRPYRPRFGLEYIGAPSVGVAFGGYGTGVGGSVQAFFSDMLNDRLIGGTLFAGGDVRDIGGSAMYLSQGHRLNWLVGAAHIPYLIGGAAGYRDTTLSVGGGGIRGLVYEQQLARLYVDQVSAVAQYPLSPTRRFEVGLSANRLGIGIQSLQTLVVGGEVVDEQQSNASALPGVNYGQATFAYVGDYSTFGFTSPIAGGRYRFEASPVFGGLNYGTLLADYRRYLFVRPVTVAVRGLHYGRYGADAERSDWLQSLFLGYGSLVRGYEIESFSAAECTPVSGNPNACPEFDRLVGSRIAVASAELRIPVFGPKPLALAPASFLPLEVSPFVDAGVAWNQDEAPILQFSRNSTARVPVFSTGLSARMNLFGAMVLEVYYAYPFQRPGKGAHFGFQLQPGW
jgi:hypothetical protein